MHESRDHSAPTFRRLSNAPRRKIVAVALSRFVLFVAWRRSSRVLRCTGEIDWVRIRQYSTTNSPGARLSDLDGAQRSVHSLVLDLLCGEQEATDCTQPTLEITQLSDE